MCPRAILPPLLLALGLLIGCAQGPNPPGARPGLPPPGWPGVKLDLFLSGLHQPTYATHAGDGSGRLFVVGRRGEIVVVRDGVPRPTPFLDLTEQVRSTGGEQGLLSVAFHPKYATNGLFFVVYTDGPGNVVVARYKVSSTNPDEADPGSALTLVHVEKPKDQHNGGLATFGPDGYLYVGIGDGGITGDPQNNAQNRGTLLGKILRLDVDRGSPYAIPADNPFVSERGARPEIWAYGLRNPWRFSFDRATGDLYIGDVGAKMWEEIDFWRAGTPGGQNFGWNQVDGTRCYRESAGCDLSAAVPPIVEYDHSRGCAVIGGFAYRGRSFPQLAGYYFYSDFCAGRLWALRQQPSGEWRDQELLKTGLRVSSFGEDESGELYLTSLTGELYRLAAAS